MPADTPQATHHDEIREWIEHHGGTPAGVSGTDGGDAEVLLVDR